MRCYLQSEIHRLWDERDGQAGIFAAMTMYTMVLFLAFAFNIGVFMGDRISAQTSADAAALTGAAWQSRSLNVITALNNVSCWSAISQAFEQAQATELMIYAAVAAVLQVGVPSVQQATDEFQDALQEFQWNLPSNAQNTAVGIAHLQAFMMDWFLPSASLIQAIARSGGFGGSGLNNATWTVPIIMPLPFMSLLGVNYLEFKTLAVSNGPTFYGRSVPSWATGLLDPNDPNQQAMLDLLANSASSGIGTPLVYTARLNDDPAFGNIRPFPDLLWSATVCYTEFQNPNSPLFPRTFPKESLILNGFLTIAQAHPYVPPNLAKRLAAQGLVATDLRGSDTTSLNDAALDWDVKLMPITADNFILSFVPALGVIIGVVGDFLLVH